MQLLQLLHRVVLREQEALEAMQEHQEIFQQVLVLLPDPVARVVLVAQCISGGLLVITQV
jgi:hypothetical protein